MNALHQEGLICRERTPGGGQMIHLGELLPGGVATGMRPEDFDHRQLAVGTIVELEHTAGAAERRAVALAREIAMDHLAEDPRYYEKLRQIHLDGSGLGFTEEIMAAIEERAGIGAEKRVKPMVMGAMALGALGLAAGVAGLVVALRR